MFNFNMLPERLECKVAGQQVEVYDNPYGREVYMNRLPLQIVLGYYGFGKTYGVGYYIACRARNEGKNYIYINLRELKSLIQSSGLGETPYEFINIRSLYDVFKNLRFGVEISERVSHRAITAFDLYPPALVDWLKTFPTSLDYNDREDEEDNNVISFLRRLETTTFLILDEFEQGYESVSDLGRFCRIAKRIEAEQIKLKIILLIQQAVIDSRRDRFWCGEERAGRGVAREIRLSGYERDFYKRILEQRKIRVERSDYLDALSLLPPRVVFNWLRDIDNGSTLDLTSLLGNTTEIFYIRQPNKDDLEYIKIGFRELVQAVECAERRHVIICSGQSRQEKRICLDTRLKAKETEECQTIFKRDGEYLAIREKGGQTMPIPLPFGVFLAALYHHAVSKNSHWLRGVKTPIYEGLGEYYNQIIEEFKKFVK